MNFVVRLLIITLLGSLLRAVERRFGFLGLVLAVGLVFAAPYLLRLGRIISAIQ